jgi:hypothetical protein
MKIKVTVVHVIDKEAYRREYGMETDEEIREAVRHLTRDAAESAIPDYIQHEVELR